MAFWKKSQPNPRDCGLQSIERRQEVRETGNHVATHHPDRFSDAYALTIKKHMGKFNAQSYRDYGGKYSTTVAPEEITVQIGHFSCRRSSTMGPLEVEDSSDVKVANRLYSTVAQLGWCATCPYQGMDEVEANLYDARKAQSEADLAQGQLARALAMDELNAHLASRGNTVEAGSVPDVPVSMPVLGDPTVQMVRKLG